MKVLGILSLEVLEHFGYLLPMIESKGPTV
jgi:hypothetical protein